MGLELNRKSNYQPEIDAVNELCVSFSKGNAENTFIIQISHSEVKFTYNKMYNFMSFHECVQCVVSTTIINI